MKIYEENKEKTGTWENIEMKFYLGRCQSWLKKNLSRCNCKMAYQVTGMIRNFSMMKIERYIYDHLFPINR